jgi:serine protease
MWNGAAVVKVSRALNPVDASRFLDALTSNASVAYAEADLIARIASVPNDPMWAQQWHYNEATAGIHLPEAYDTADGAGIVVADIDTGRTVHPDLDANMLAGYDFISSAATARDGNGRDADPSDEGDWETAGQCGFPARNSSWHGTHTAGTIAAVTDNGVGVAGVAPAAKILPVRVLGVCGGTFADIIDAIVWSSGGTVPGVPANPTPADVINMSLGGSGACTAGSALQLGINTAIANGTAVVVSAGNSTADAANFQPASCSGVVTVAATDRAGNRAFYSNFGATVELAAPGGETSPTPGDGVLSTLNTGRTVPVGPTYGFYQGTSMAAPHVSGVAALVLGEQSMTPAALTTRLQSTSRAFPGSCAQCGSGLSTRRPQWTSAGRSPAPSASPRPPRRRRSRQPASRTSSSPSPARVVRAPPR